jgi:hypothetical protein
MRLDLIPALVRNVFQENAMQQLSDNEDVKYINKRTEKGRNKRSEIVRGEEE